MRVLTVNHRWIIMVLSFLPARRYANAVHAMTQSLSAGGARYCDERNVGLRVYLLRISQKSHAQTFRSSFRCSSAGRCSGLLWQRCDTLCISGIWMACSPVSSLCPAVEGALSDTAICSSVRLSVPAGLRLRHRLLAAQLSCKQPELCGLRIRRHTDVDPPRSAAAAYCLAAR